MNKFFSSALVSTLATVSLTASSAHAQNTFEDHEDLFLALQQAGVTVTVNSKLHCNRGADGMYYPGSVLLVICQDNMQTHAKNEAWTNNDLDTLRHEAHHVIQDCAADSLGDGKLTTMFNEDQLIDFLKTSPSYTLDQLKALYAELKQDGLSDLGIQQEMEAYVVAKDIPAASISEKVRQFCF